jgi:hypothetical protein
MSLNKLISWVEKKKFVHWKEPTSKIAGTGMIKSKYRVALGFKNISSNMIALTAPLAP